MLALCASLLAAPAYANETLLIEGAFAEQGPLENGYFEGSFSYNPETPDINPNVVNVGVFQLSDFEIKIFDSQSREVETLTDENSEGLISLSAPPTTGEATLFRVSTIPDDFFATGTLIGVTFDVPDGGNPNLAPQTLPGQFVEGQFAPAAEIQNAQVISEATTRYPTQPDNPSSGGPVDEHPSTVSTDEYSSIVGLCLTAVMVFVSRLVPKCSQKRRRNLA